MPEHERHPELVRKRARAIMAERAWRTFLAVVMALALIAIMIDIQATRETRRIIREENDEHLTAFETIVTDAAVCAGEEAAAGDPQDVVADAIRKCIRKKMEERQ